MKIAFQLRTPGVNFDWRAQVKVNRMVGFSFLLQYRTSDTLLEVNASQRDKDFIMAVNWKKAEEYINAGKGKKTAVKYAHNCRFFNEDANSHINY